jgi:hypothetical protein
LHGGLHRRNPAASSQPLLHDDPSNRLLGTQYNRPDFQTEPPAEEKLAFLGKYFPRLAIFAE